MTSIFGPSIDSSDVEKALIAHLRAYMPTYIPYVRRVKDPEAKRWPNGVAEIRDYSLKLADDEKWPEDQLPMILVHSPGMERQPTIEGGGNVEAYYGAAVLAIAEGRDQEDSRELSRLYGRAATLAIMQHSDLDAGTGKSFSLGVDMGPESNSPVTRGVEADRSLSVVSVAYVITVSDVFSVSGGPLAPLTTPETEPPEWPTVAEDGGSTRIEQGADKVELLRQGGFFP